MRGRKPTGKAMSNAQRQAGHRERKNAALQALSDDPMTVGILSLDVLLTLDDVMAVAGSIQEEVLDEYAGSIAEVDE
jgi:hypothetical protein